MPESMRASRVILFRELVQEALVYSEAHKRTVRQDRSYWKSLDPVFGNLPADTISPALIEEYFKRRTDLKPATINRLRSFLSMVFQQAIRNGKAEKNPARLVRLRKEANARIRFLTFEEEDLIRAIILDGTPTHEPASPLRSKPGCASVSSTP